MCVHRGGGSGRAVKHPMGTVIAGASAAAAAVQVQGMGGHGGKAFKFSADLGEGTGQDQGLASSLFQLANCIDIKAGRSGSIRPEVPC